MSLPHRINQYIPSSYVARLNALNMSDDSKLHARVLKDYDKRNEMLERLRKEREMLDVELHISKVTNGWLVRAGCYTFVFNNREELIMEFTRFIVKPEEVYKEYTKKYGRITELAGENIDAVPYNDMLRSTAQERVDRGRTSRET